MVTVKVGGGLMSQMKRATSSTPKLGLPVKEFPPKKCTVEWITLYQGKGWRMTGGESGAPYH